VVSRRPGKVAEAHRLSRNQFIRFFAERKSALVLLEACGTARFWARQLLACGHRVRLLPPHQIRPYVQRDKTDLADAKALLEAHRNDDIKSVPAKSVTQQIITSLHRLRSAWLRDRVARLNLVRAILGELGVALPVGAMQVVPRTWALLDAPGRAVPTALDSLGEAEDTTAVSAIDHLASVLRTASRRALSASTTTPPRA
jgi:transposase